jgi:hypothetical protein
MSASQLAGPSLKEDCLGIITQPMKSRNMRDCPGRDYRAEHARRKRYCRPPPPPAGAITLAEAGRRFGVSPRTAYRLGDFISVPGREAAAAKERRYVDPASFAALLVAWLAVQAEREVRDELTRRARDFRRLWRSARRPQSVASKSRTEEKSRQPSPVRAEGGGHATN